MITTGYHHYASRWRAHGVLCLLLLALAVRGMIPVGYMPDTSALRDGRIVITFCTAAGNVAAAPAMLAGLFAHGDSQSTDILAGNDCPFGVLSHQALGLPVLSAVRVAPAAVFFAPVFFFNSTALPALGARGPPLGPRAPPFFFS